MNIQNKAAIIVGIAIVLVSLIHEIYLNEREKYENSVLEDTKSCVVTWAVYSQEKKGVGITGMSFYFYNEFGKKKSFDKTHYYKGVNEGDTVTIVYSTDDNSVVRVIKKSWKAN